MSTVAREAVRLASAIGFLTRLPVPAHGWEDGRLGRASRYFGLVGLLVGAGSVAVLLAALQAGLSPGVAAGLALATGIAMSGALHEDGLADCADALGGHAPRARALEILRDSRIGTYGALALVLALGLRWTALAALAAAGPEPATLALMLAATAGRGLMVAAAVIPSPARGDGLASGFAPRPVEALMALAPAVVLVAALGAAGAAAMAVAAAGGALLLRRARSRLGGHTGDVLGGVAAVAETAVLVVLSGTAR